MIVVSDTSPVSNLIVIERLDILEKLFTEIIVPPTKLPDGKKKDL